MPILAVLVIYAANGALGSFWYWFYTYNTRIYMEPYASSPTLVAVAGWMQKQPLVTLALALPIVGGLVAPLVRASSISARELVKSYAAVGLEATVAMMTAVALASAFTPQRFWDHYFLTVIPFMGLLIGLRLSAALEGVEKSPIVPDGGGPRPPMSWGPILAHGVVGLALVLLLAQGTTQRLHSFAKARATGGFTNHRANPVCEVVDAHSQPSEPIFLWGFDGDFYVDCSRKPASRFVFTTMVAGVVAPRWGEPKDARIAPGVAELLASDLRSSRPPLILDFHKTLGGRTSMRRVPELARLLDEGYCRLGEVEARGRPAHIWVRQDREGCGSKR